MPGAATALVSGLRNRKIPLDEFLKQRQEVLAQWPTGREVVLEEALEYQLSIPEHKRFSKALSKAKSEGRTLTQPRAGVPLIEEQIKLLRYLEEKGEADLLPTTIDSYTRLNRYREAQKGLEESAKLKRAMLNGFPAVNHGVKGCRRLTEAVSKPIEVRHGTPDSRLLAEITLAGGFTSFEGGPLTYNIPYSKNFPIGRCIKYWQYVYRLAGYYTENGAEINIEPFGALTGTLVPPYVAIPIDIIEAMLAAEQGVKSITVGYGQNGNLIQDISAMRVLEKLTVEYLNRFGYKDVEVTTVFHQWMGGFPEDEARAFGVIALGAAAAALSKATKVIVKTPHEAFGVPTPEANAQGLRATKQVINMLSCQHFPDCEEMRVEMDMIEKASRAILDRVLELGDGDVAVGTVLAIKSGVLDVPFAPHMEVKGRILPARDAEGAVRLIDYGLMPVPKEVVEYEREKLAERAQREKRRVSFHMTIDDVYAISDGFLVGHRSATRR